MGFSSGEFQAMLKKCDIATNIVMLTNVKMPFRAKDAVIISGIFSLSEATICLIKPFCIKPFRAISMRAVIVVKSAQIPNSSLGRIRTSKRKLAKLKSKPNILRKKLYPPDFIQYELALIILNY